MATSTAQTSNRMAATFISFWNSQITPPSIGKNGPSCARPSITSKAPRIAGNMPGPMRARLPSVYVDA
ncbi:hypothetical protein G6F46_015800 [Rhizopus delemar]|nr:hypothetical protein G6F46_015800 [Rhizopus delemar]